MQDNNIHYACEIGDISIVKLLLANSSCVNNLDQYKRIPLHLACKFNKPEIVKLLIDNNSNINSKCYDKWTPLHYVCLKITDSIEIAKLLIDCGSLVNELNYRKHTPLYYACLFNGNLELVKLLIQNGADINIKYKEKTILELAIYYKRTEIVNYLTQNN